MVQSIFEELRDLDSLRFKETQRQRLLQEALSRRHSAPYTHFSCLDAAGITERSAEQEHIVHWGPSGVCAIAIGNLVYLVHPVVEAQTQAITPCLQPHVVTCVRWLDSYSQVNAQESVQVLAIATSCPQGRLQIWECTRNVLLRVLNKSHALFSSLAWNHSYLVGSTRCGSLIVNDVRLQKSETLNARLSPTALSHCAFSHDRTYLSLTSPQVVSLYQPKLEHTLLHPQQLNKLAALPALEVGMVAWCKERPSYFAVAVKVMDPSCNNTACFSEVQVYDTTKQQCVAKLQIRSQVNCMLWVKASSAELRLLAGLQDGRIAVLRVQGSNQVVMECQAFLIFHSTPVLFMQESPYGQYMCSIGQDEVLFVWKRVDNNTQGMQMIRPMIR